MTNTNTNTITIRNRQYVVIKAENYTHKGNDRTQFTVRKPRGTKTFLVVKYENGLYSSFA